MIENDACARNHQTQLATGVNARGTRPPHGDRPCAISTEHNLQPYRFRIELELAAAAEHATDTSGTYTTGRVCARPVAPVQSLQNFSPGFVRV
jgi:hypothetical protein